MDYSMWDEMTLLQTVRCECRCSNYWRPQQITSARKIRFYKIIVVVQIFATSLALLALSLHCHWSQRCCLDDHADGRRLPIEQEASAEMTSSRHPGDGDERRSPVRAKRESHGQNSPSHIPSSFLPRRQPCEMKGRKMALRELRRKIATARSYCDVVKIVRRAGLAADLCPSTMSSKGHRPNQRPRPSSLNKTTTTTTTTAAAAAENCPMINVSIVGSFSQTNKGDRVGFRVCGPNSTRDDGAISDRKKKHSEWMSKARKKGVCRPMPLVVDLKPERGGPDSEKSGQTIVLVRKCSLLYSPIENRVTPDCHSVKSVKRTVHFKGGGGHVNSYEIYDDVICLARVTSEEEETGAKNTPSKKHAKKCPWPFRRRKTGHCSCRRKNKDSAGYLVYRSCQMVRKGVWRLQDKQQECVHLGRCQPPKCDGTRVYDAARGRCLLAAQPQLTSTAASAGPDGQDGAANRPFDGQRPPPPRTAQEATRSPADT